jgi:hypothetical protein
MPDAPARLAALTSASLPAPDARQWRRDMERAIATGHTAAWIAGTSERLGVPVGGLLNPRNLSRAERAELKATIAAQLKYLDGFDRAGMSEAAIAARAELYPGATRQTYYMARWGDWDIPGDLMPGNQECITQCKCEISVKDNGDGTGVLTRTMHAEAHCTECPPLAGDHPVKRRRRE